MADFCLFSWLTDVLSKLQRDLLQTALHCPDPSAGVRGCSQWLLKPWQGWWLVRGINNYPSYIGDYFIIQEQGIPMNQPGEFLWFNIGLGWKPNGPTGDEEFMKGEPQSARSDMKFQDVWKWEIEYPQTAMMSQFVVIKHGWDPNKVIRLNWAVAAIHPGRMMISSGIILPCIYIGDYNNPIVNKPTNQLGSPIGFPYWLSLNSYCFV